MSVSKPEYLDCADAPLAVLEQIGSSGNRSGVDIQLTHDELIELVKKLKSSCRQDQLYRKALSEAKKFIPSPEKSVYSKTLSQSDAYRLTVIGIHKLVPIPAHDHPHTVSVLIALTGKLRIRHFRETGSKPDHQLIELEQCSEQILESNNVDIVSDEAGNLHSLEAATNHATFLCIQLPPCPAENQSWYYPLDPFESCQKPSLWKSIRNPSLAV